MLFKYFLAKSGIIVLSSLSVFTGLKQQESCRSVIYMTTCTLGIFSGKSTTILIYSRKPQLVKMDSCFFAAVGGQKWAA